MPRARKPSSAVRATTTKSSAKPKRRTAKSSGDTTMTIAGKIDNGFNQLMQLDATLVDHPYTMLIDQPCIYSVQHNMVAANGAVIGLDVTPTHANANGGERTESTANVTDHDSTTVSGVSAGAGAGASINAPQCESIDKNHTNNHANRGVAHSRDMLDDMLEEPTPSDNEWDGSSGSQYEPTTHRTETSSDGYDSDDDGYDSDDDGSDGEDDGYDDDDDDDDEIFENRSKGERYTTKRKDSVKVKGKNKAKAKGKTKAKEKTRTKDKGKAKAKAKAKAKDKGKTKAKAKAKGKTKAKAKGKAKGKAKAKNKDKGTTKPKVPKKFDVKNTKTKPSSVSRKRPRSVDGSTSNTNTIAANGYPGKKRPKTSGPEFDPLKISTSANRTIEHDNGVALDCSTAKGQFTLDWSSSSSD